VHSNKILLFWLIIAYDSYKVGKHYGSLANLPL
jgi:hypothetical protein